MTALSSTKSISLVPFPRMKPKAPGEDALVEDSEDEDEGFLDSTFDRDCYFVITLVDYPDVETEVVETLTEYSYRSRLTVEFFIQ